jgi:hypothetical protein
MVNLYIPVRCSNNCKKNEEQEKKIQQQRIWGTVRVPTSLYLSEKTALNVVGTRGLNNRDNTPLSKYNLVNWNQSSDRNKPSMLMTSFPSGGNSTKTTKTSIKPGAGIGGNGVDIKHGSYARYLARKKGSNNSHYPIVEDNPPKYGNKDRSYNIINPSDEKYCGCVIGLNPNPGPPGCIPCIPKCDFNNCGNFNLEDKNTILTSYNENAVTQTNTNVIQFSSIISQTSRGLILATVWGSRSIYVSTNSGASYEKIDVSASSSDANWKNLFNQSGMYCAMGWPRGNAGSPEINTIWWNQSLNNMIIGESGSALDPGNYKNWTLEDNFNNNIPPQFNSPGNPTSFSYDILSTEGRLITRTGDALLLLGDSLATWQAISNGAPLETQNCVSGAIGRRSMAAFAYQIHLVGPNGWYYSESITSGGGIGIQDRVPTWIQVNNVPTSNWTACSLANTTGTICVACTSTGSLCWVNIGSSVPPVQGEQVIKIVDFPNENFIDIDASKNISTTHIAAVTKEGLVYVSVDQGNSYTKKEVEYFDTTTCKCYRVEWQKVCVAENGGTITLAGRKQNGTTVIQNFSI